MLTINISSGSYAISNYNISQFSDRIIQNRLEFSQLGIVVKDQLSA